MATPQLFVGEFGNAVWLIPQTIGKAGFNTDFNPFTAQSLPSPWVSTIVVDSVGIAAKTIGTASDFFSITVDDATQAATIVLNIQDPFDVNKRAAVRDAFETFRAGIDDLEGGSTPAIAPGAGRLIVQKLVDAIPVMLAPQATADGSGVLYEPLFFRYGLRPRQVDLHPGMRLRVDQAPNQFVPPAQSMVNGNAGSGTTHYVVSERSSDRRLTFDNFLSSAGPLTVDRSNPAFISGVIDLENASDARRLYRLFYPGSISSAYQQATTVAANVTLAGANTVAELNSAYPTPAANSKVVYSFFRGRAVVVPEVQVFVNDNPVYVPLGTTVRQVLEANTNWGIAGMQAANTKQKYGQVLFVSRYWGPGAEAGRGLDPQPEVNLGPANIQFGPRTAEGAASGPPPKPSSVIFDLPLIQGDMISWEVPTVHPIVSKE